MTKIDRLKVAILVGWFMAGYAVAQPDVSIDSKTVILHGGDSAFALSLQCPRFVVGDTTVGGDIAPVNVSKIIPSEGPLEVVYPPIALPAGKLEAKLYVQWFPDESVIRKWAACRIVAGASPSILKEVVLEDADVTGRKVHTFPGETQSYPVFVDGFFVGIEYPVASTRVENDRLIVAHRPGRRLERDTWYESRKAVYGVAERGHEMEAFHRYIRAHRPQPSGMHVNYNSWWTSPIPRYTEQDILDLMATFEKNLYAPHRVSFDTFCIDMGWSNPNSLWEIDPALFPEGFTRIQAAAERMGCRLGLWISPCSAYPPALDNVWAKEHGYEAMDGALCLGGPHYAAAFRDRLVDMVTRYGIRHVKLDGYRLECPEADHGHEPGPLSAEAIADGFIAVTEALRKAAPDIWLEPTCFGWNPSPWWLFYCNSVIGSYGDDAPHGRVPAPVYCESYTTGRDYYNLQGAQWSPVPQAAQEVLGIIHQTDEPFLNDAVMTVLRGHMFLPLYLNPKYMDDARWASLAQTLTWARANAPRLQETEVLLPASWRDGRCPKFSAQEAMPREVYGYAHWTDDGGLVALRNPWIARETYSVTLPARLGTCEYVARSVYPESRIYGSGLRANDTLAVPVAPYETLVLSFDPEAVRHDVQVSGECAVDASVSRQEVSRVVYDTSEPALGPDWSSLVGEAESCCRATFEVDTKASPKPFDLVILIDGTSMASDGIALRINGCAVTPAITGSDSGWSATGLERPEHWLFLQTPLEGSGTRYAIELDVPGGSAKVSAWLCASKPGESGGAPGTLPQPESIPVGSFMLMEPTAPDSVDTKVAKAPRPVERIRGVFLDALEPASATQEYGTPQKNRSVWEKPMTIAGKRYYRGVGTHSPSTLVYALDGKYTRFQAWAGADGATTPTITFEVWADGERRWESGYMTREDPAKRVDLDMSGVQTLELRVGDGGNDFQGDHADWADARLLR